MAISSSERKYYVAAFLCGAATGAGLCLVLGRILLMRTVESRVEAKLEAEHAHRQARAETEGDNNNASKRPAGAVANPFAAAGPTARAKTSGYVSSAWPQQAPESESEQGPGEQDAGQIAPDVDTWPPVDRDPTKPYIISADEFADMPEYYKVSLKWFQGDNIPVMVDDKDQPIRHYEKLVGSIGYRSFGGPSLDENIAYIRNDLMHTDFEVLRRFGSYAEEILNYGRPG